MDRPSTTARGYGTSHQATRKRWAHTVNAGEAVCTRCQQPIEPGAPWDLDHTDDRTAYAGAAHQSCNRAAGQAKAQRRHKMTIRD